MTKLSERVVATDDPDPVITCLLVEIDVSALIIVGAEDSLYPIQSALSMHEQIAYSTLAIIPGGSHATIFEVPGRASVAILGWASNL